jgi:hypothetical protein
MNQDRTGQHKFQERRGADEARPQTTRGSGDPGRRADGDERKPSPIERRDWRGSGVCGDRHTD